MNSYLPAFPVHRCYFLLLLLNDYVYDISAVLFLKPPPNTGVIYFRVLLDPS